MIGTQESLFDKKKYVGVLPQNFQIKPPAANHTVFTTLPAYKAYLQSGGYSKYTPDDFTADIRKFGTYVHDKKLADIRTVDIQQWIGELKKVMTEKTVNRKISAIINYFLWLATEGVLKDNPAQGVWSRKITSPLPDILYESECTQLSTAASDDPRAYLLVVLLLETGIKKEEIVELLVTNFDFSNKYAPEVWIKHTGKKVWKDRKLKLPAEVVPVFNDYVKQYSIKYLLFSCTPRTLELTLANLAEKAGVQKKVTAGILRDTFAVRQLRKGEDIDNLLTKMGFSPTTGEDAKTKYLRLASRAL